MKNINSVYTTTISIPQLDRECQNKKGIMLYSCAHDNSIPND